jgi:hypothetical protein
VAVTLNAPDFFGRFVFHASPTSCISTLDKAVILSEALRRPIANEGLCGAQSKEPGDACWQMLLGVFNRKLHRKIKKFTNDQHASLLSHRRTVIRHYHEG